MEFNDSWGSAFSIHVLRERKWGNWKFGLLIRGHMTQREKRACLFASLPQTRRKPKGGRITIQKNICVNSTVKKKCYTKNNGNRFRLWYIVKFPVQRTRKINKKAEGLQSSHHNLTYYFRRTCCCNSVFSGSCPLRKEKFDELGSAAWLSDILVSLYYELAYSRVNDFQPQKNVKFNNRIESFSIGERNITMGRQNLGCCLVALIVLQLALPALALPQMFNKFAEQGKYFLK